MLSDLKLNYENLADVLDVDWKSINKNKLCNLCVENEGTLNYDAYVAAIILRYWPKLDKLKYKTYKDRIYCPDEDIYDIFVEGILYALRNKRWLQEDSTLFEDPNGPDKAINIKIKYAFMNYINSNFRQKRLLNMNIYSIDKNIELYGDSIKDDSKDFYYDDYDSGDLKQYVRSLMASKDYFTAFLMDGIIHISTDDQEIIKHLKTLDDSYARIFSENYGLEFDLVKRSIAYVNNLTTKQLKDKLKYSKFILGKTLDLLKD